MVKMVQNNSLSVLAALGRWCKSPPKPDNMDEAAVDLMQQHRRVLLQRQRSRVSECLPLPLPPAVPQIPVEPQIETPSEAKKSPSLISGIGRILGLLVLLYLFICSLDFLSAAFRLLAGRAAGEFMTKM